MNAIKQKDRRKKYKEDLGKIGHMIKMILVHLPPEHPPPDNLTQSSATH